MAIRDDRDLFDDDGLLDFEDPTKRERAQRADRHEARGPAPEERRRRRKRRPPRNESP